MTLSTLIIILRVQWRMIAGITGGAILLALLVTLIMPKTYEATTDLIIDSKNQDPISGQMSQTRLTPNYIGTQVDIIQSGNVADKVITQEKLESYPDLAKVVKLDDSKPIRNQIKAFLKSGLSVTPDRESTIVTVSFKSKNPEISAKLANAIAQAYIQTNLELLTAPAKQINQWYDQQLASLRKTLVEKQDALSAYQEKHSILVDANKVDLETAKLTELSNMLTAVQGERLNTESRSNQIADSKVATPAQALDNPQIQKLAADYSQAEAHLNELGSQVGEKHPQYIQAQSDVEGLKQQLNHALQLVSGNLRSSIALSQSREIQLQAEFDAQKERVLQLSRNRNELNLLMQEVENAQSAFNAALSRSSQTKLESLISQTDVAVLNTATPPSRSSSPKALMNLLLASIVGLLLGVAIVIGIEWFDSRIRSEEDFEYGLGLPVLAVIPANPAVTANTGGKLV